jgi:hypothetical protein
MNTVIGDAQSSQIVLNAGGIVQPNGSVNLQSNGSNIRIPNNGVIGFEAHLVAASSGGTSTFLKFEGAAKNYGGASIVGTVTQFTVAEDSPGIHVLSISASGSDLIFTFRSSSNLETKVVCYVRYTQTIF